MQLNRDEAGSLKSCGNDAYLCPGKIRTNLKNWKNLVWYCLSVWCWYRTCFWLVTFSESTKVKEDEKLLCLDRCFGKCFCNSETTGCITEKPASHFASSFSKKTFGCGNNMGNGQNMFILEIWVVNLDIRDIAGHVHYIWSCIFGWVISLRNTLYSIWVKNYLFDHVSLQMFLIKSYYTQNIKVV